MKGNGESATNNYQISTADAHMSARNIDAPNTLFARKHSQKKYGDEKKIKTAERILRANCPLSAADIFFAPSSDFMADISREGEVGWKCFEGRNCCECERKRYGADNDNERCPRSPLERERNCVKRVDKGKHRIFTLAVFRC